jgi:hypothetical protein
MKRCRQILALLLLVLMGPASVCCLAAPQNVSEDSCGCCSTESDQEHKAPAQPDLCPSDTIARSQMPAPIAMPPMQMVELTDIIHAMVPLDEPIATKAAPLPLLTTAPPQLRTTWVFASRAALPARAPSDLG